MGEQKNYTNNASNVVTGVTYTWYVSTASNTGPWAVGAGTGATTQSYTTISLPAGTRYYVLSAKCTATGDSTLSNVITLVVNPLPTATASTAGAVCAGSPSNIQFTFTGTGPWNFTYSRPGGPVTTSSATSPYTVPGAAVAGA